MVKNMIFGGSIPRSKLQKIVEERLESNKKQNKSIQETAEDIAKDVEVFLEDQEIRMK